MFENDLEFGKKAEGYILKKIQKKYPEAVRIDGYCRGYDIIAGDIQIEVKCDRLSKKTGNFAVEFSYNGQPSGIITTEADYWAMVVWSDFEDSWVAGLIDVVDLYELCQDKQTKKGGDNAEFYLLSVDGFFTLGIKNKMDYKQEASEIIIQLGKNLRSERYRLGISQFGLCKITDLDSAFVSRFERGDFKDVHLRTFLKINGLITKLQKHNRESIEKLLKQRKLLD
jgi:hypothetical protein